MSQDKEEKQGFEKLALPLAFLLTDFGMPNFVPLCHFKILGAKCLSEIQLS